jgi:tetratricopeptide (TPR) repeat protein
LVDQHTNELTFTQLSRSAIENSAPAQDRLRFLHSIVYPPRWELKKDLAERYSALGILVSASQIYEQLELWDDVVDCYSRMGKKKQALALVRDRLEKGDKETPRLLCALGDLSSPPESTDHYRRAWQLSGGRYAKAMRRLGREAFNLANISAAALAKQQQQQQQQQQGEKDEAKEKEEQAGEGNGGDLGSVGGEGGKRADSKGSSGGGALDDDPATRAHLVVAQESLRAALVLQPSQTSDWFVLGTVCMRLEDWQAALTAFSTVVAHEADSGDAWGNVGAVHLRLRRPDLALAAFTEGLKASRESWRMWENRLLAALQVRPRSAAHANDAVLSTNQLLDLQKRGLGRGVDTPLLAAVVSAALEAEGCSPDANGGRGGWQRQQQEGSGSGAEAEGGFDESIGGPNFKDHLVLRKTCELLTRVTALTDDGNKKVDPKAWEVFALFNASCGRRRAARECHVKRCRQLQASAGWEKRLHELDALADAAHDLVFLGCLPPPPPPPPLTTTTTTTTTKTTTTTTTTRSSATALAPSPPSAPASGDLYKEEAKELALAQLLLRGIAKKASAFGSVAEKGNAARAKLEEALTALDAHITSLARI